MPDVCATALSDVWRDDLVALLLGTSHSADIALAAAGIAPFPPGGLSPTFATTRGLRRVGRFGGSMTVTMRAVPTDRVAQAARITGAHPMAHGAPVHCGDLCVLGIADAAHKVPLGTRDTAMFWASGRTLRDVLRAAELPICISHSPMAHVMVHRDVARIGGGAVRTHAAAPPYGTGGRHYA